MRRGLVDAALVATAAADVLLTAPAGGHPVYACSLLAAAVLPLRRRWPRTTLLLVLPGLFAGVAVLAAVFALYAVATAEHRRRWLYAATGVVALGAALPWPAAELFTQPPDELARSVIYGVLAGCAPTALGLAVRTRAELTDRLAELAERRAREQEWTTQRVLATERARLAREMHDVVSHQVSLIAVTAGAWRVGAIDDAGREAAEEIRRRAARTLVELRHMVGVLRACPTAPLTPGPVPQAGLADVPALVDEHEGAVLSGLPDAAGVPEAQQRAAYRTVQEALTNVRKHAPGAATTVSVSTTADELHVTVTNTSPTRRSPEPPGPSASGTQPPMPTGLSADRQTPQRRNGSPGDRYVPHGPTGWEAGWKGNRHGPTGWDGSRHGPFGWDGSRHGPFGWDVEPDGPGGGWRSGAEELPGGGHGLSGLRERAALLGGRLVAGPTGDGYVIRLALPLADRGRMIVPQPRPGEPPCADDST
ncbi:histidine kinase [Longispora sp. NPDC051575]|uniref:sensor histidine kinase n=1 Tax=Longispora sp. NPDC051575 TaxID=3154943 RepID=UPI003433DBC0